MSSPSATQQSYPHHNDPIWSRSEKTIARKAFDDALGRELHEVIQEAKKMASQIQQSAELWELEHYLTQRRKEINRKYDYRYSELTNVFGRLLHEGRLSDGKWVAYVTYPEGKLWRSRVDGTQKLQLTSTTPELASLPRWSPDGKQITFAGGIPSYPASLYVISADGGTPRSFSVAKFSVLAPNWLPDGRSIVFQDAVGTNAERAGLKIVDLKTLQITAIPELRNVLEPVASPDGRYVAAVSVDGQRLMLLDIASRKWAELINMNVGFTSWSSDSRYVYFDTGLSENPAYYRVRVSDRNLERLADLKGFRRVVFGGFPWSGVTLDGAPLLLRDISSQEVYALDFDAP